MDELLSSLRSPLFEGLEAEGRKAVLSCVGYHIASYRKGQIIAFEADRIRHVGVVLSGTVDMVKEDIWGNKALLMRLGQDDLFGETFACGSDNLSLVTFSVAEDSKILFLPFDRSMRCCTNACEFHHQLTANMVRCIADKNRDLMQKLEVMSKRTTREKLLAYLSLQAQAQNSRYFEIPLGRVELAEYLCIDRSAMTRELTKMKEDGLIDFDRNCFRML